MRYHLSTLKREVSRLKGSIDAGNAPVVLNLGDGENYSIRSKDLCKFGAAALFDEGSCEHRAIKLAIEPINPLARLLQMVLCGKGELLPTE